MAKKKKGPVIRNQKVNKKIGQMALYKKVRGRTEREMVKQKRNEGQKTQTETGAQYEEKFGVG